MRGCGERRRSAPSSAQRARYRPRTPRLTRAPTAANDDDSAAGSTQMENRAEQNDQRPQATTARRAAGRTSERTERRKALVLDDDWTTRSAPSCCCAWKLRRRVVEPARLARPPRERTFRCPCRRRGPRPASATRSPRSPTARHHSARPPACMSVRSLQPARAQTLLTVYCASRRLRCATRSCVRRSARLLVGTRR